VIGKNQLLDTIKNLPEKFSVDEPINRLVLIQKIEEGLQQVKEQKTVSYEAAKKRMSKRLKWFGPSGHLQILMKLQTTLHMIVHARQNNEFKE